MATPITYGVSKAQNPAKLSLFLDLPLDIRLLLLEDMFIYPSGISLRCKVSIGLQPQTKTDNPSLFQIQSSVGLLSTCRQLHSEILKILYSRNQFKICCAMRGLDTRT
jgi:hypothetical protein